MTDPVAARDRLARLGSDDPDAWPEFLREYAPVLLQVARDVERDPDAVSDAFLFICEQLAARRCAKLRQFNPDGTASFLTWLRVVAWNLAIDARRRRLGRFRPLAAIRGLPLLQQRLFRLRHEEGLTFDQAFATLQPEFPGLMPAALNDADEQVARRLDSRQRWLLATRRPRVESMDSVLDESGAEVTLELQDEAPDPQWRLLAEQDRARLTQALARLEPAERLLLQLRYEEGLTLARVAHVCGLKDPWAADRRLRDLLGRLRASLGASR